MKKLGNVWFGGYLFEAGGIWLVCCLVIFAAASIEEENWNSDETTTLSVNPEPAVAANAAIKFPEKPDKPRTTFAEDLKAVLVGRSTKNKKTPTSKKNMVVWQEYNQLTLGGPPYRKVSNACQPSSVCFAEKMYLNRIRMPTLDRDKKRFSKDDEFFLMQPNCLLDANTFYDEITSNNTEFGGTYREPMINHRNGLFLDHVLNFHDRLNRSLPFFLLDEIPAQYSKIRIAKILHDAVLKADKSEVIEKYTQIYVQFDFCPYYNNTPPYKCTGAHAVLLVLDRTWTNDKRVAVLDSSGFLNPIVDEKCGMVTHFNEFVNLKTMLEIVLPTKKYRNKNNEQYIVIKLLGIDKEKVPQTATPLFDPVENVKGKKIF